VIGGHGQREEPSPGRVKFNWPGDSSSNRSIGADPAPPGSGEPHVPEMAEEEYEAHAQAMFAKYGLD